MCADYASQHISANKQSQGNHLTRNIIPVGPIGDAVFESLLHGVGAVGLAELHRWVILGVHQRQVAEQAIILRLAVVALLLMGGWVVERVTGHHGAAVQVRWQHKSGEAHNTYQGQLARPSWSAAWRRSDRSSAMVLILMMGDVVNSATGRCNRFLQSDNRMALRNVRRQRFTWVSRMLKYGTVQHTLLMILEMNCNFSSKVFGTEANLICLSWF